jgi:SAM-dependent methyltransferase
MRRLIVMAGMAAAVAGVAAWVARSRSATWADWRKRLLWSYAGVPSGPLGWVGSRMMHWGSGPLYRLVADALRLQPDDDLLEVACGSGVFLREHAPHVRHVAGLDLSEIQVGLARRRLADRIAAGTAEIVMGDAGAVPWEDAHFSAVACMAAFEAFPDPERALAEIHRVLRPGGRSVLTMGKKVDDADVTGDKDAMGVWIWGEADARRLMEEAGFADVSIAYCRMAGDSRLSNLVDGAEIRLVRGVKPA